MDPIEKLTELFETFPGIGPRQAGRFVQFLLRSSSSARREMSDALISLGGSVHRCEECMRFFADTGKICGICANPRRDPSVLAVVATDADLLALERSGTFRGEYFVLGCTISLASDNTSGLHIKELLSSIPRRIDAGLTEVILALPANPEGDATAIRVHEEIAATNDIKITTLGRGLSTGSELEYADPETLKNAFENRR